MLIMLIIMNCISRLQNGRYGTWQASRKSPRGLVPRPRRRHAGDERRLPAARAGAAAAPAPRRPLRLHARGGAGNRCPGELGALSARRGRSRRPAPGALDDPVDARRVRRRRPQGAPPRHRTARAHRRGDARRGHRGAAEPGSLRPRARPRRLRPCRAGRGLRGRARQCQPAAEPPRPPRRAAARSARLARTARGPAAAGGRRGGRLARTDAGGSAGGRRRGDAGRPRRARQRGGSALVQPPSRRSARRRPNASSSGCATTRPASG